MYLLTSFTVQNFKKTWEQIQSDEDSPFLGQNDQIALNKIFFRKAINIISMSLLAKEALCKIVKQSWQWKQSREEMLLWVLDGLFAQARFFWGEKPLI